MAKKWLGSKPDTCNICSQPFKNVFIDGRTRMGPWGLLCSGCHRTIGVGLGLGKGQLYDLKTLKKLEG